MVVGSAGAAVAATTAVQPVAGDACNANTLPANDDGSTATVALPFAINFFGNTFGSAVVNNNGNITFGAPLGQFTPTDLTTNTTIPIIAPFFADVDTTGVGSNVVKYGATADGKTFCVNWVDVGYFSGHADKLNSFQLLLIDRSQNPGGVAGDFDIVMNYDRILWETGDASNGTNGLGGISARAGYSNGTGTTGTFFEFPGSGVNGALLDSGPNGLVNSNRNAPGQNGRYIFQVRAGLAPTGATMSGHIYQNSVAPANALAGAFVQVCPTAGGRCGTSSTGSDGSYQVGALQNGSYDIRALPPGGSSLLPATRASVTISGGANLTGQDLVLTGPIPIPAGTTITSRYVSPGGQPVVYWNDPLVLTTHGCVGGTATYSVQFANGEVISGAMSESGGTYTATIPPLYPRHDNARVTISISCPDLSTQTIPFDIYIDPSGMVVDELGNPIVGATVTLLRFDDGLNSFVPVPNGSGIMSPENQTNPGVTDGRGLFGWDVIAGAYEVRAEKPGCVSAADPSQTAAVTPVLNVPPPAVNLVIRLQCSVITAVVPARLLETRSGLATVDGLQNAVGIRDIGSITEVQVAGRGGVPTGAKAAVLNVTVTEAQGAGFVTVYPCGAGRPNASNLNYVTGSTVPNAVVSAIGTDGKVCLFTSGATHLIVDVNGYVSAAASFGALVPARLLETRSGLGTVDGQLNAIGIRDIGSITEVQVIGRAGVPAGATAAVLNVTVTEAQGAGFVTVYPCGSGIPNASNLNYVVGSTVPNAVVSTIGTDGKVCLFTSNSAHLIVDVNGYIPAGASFGALVPARLLETRSGLATVDGQQNAVGIRDIGSITEVQVVGRAGVPATAAAAVLNVTVTEAQGAGFVTVYPCGAAIPNASNLNYVVGSTVPNAVISKIGTGGKVCLFTSNATHLIVDVNGFIPAI